MMSKFIARLAGTTIEEINYLETIRDLQDEILVLQRQLVSANITKDGTLTHIGTMRYHAGIGTYVAAEEGEFLDSYIDKALYARKA